MPVEASIEDLHDIQSEPSRELIQADARARSPSELEEKLNRELQYHKHGSYNCEGQLEAASYHNTSNPFLQNHLSASDYYVRQLTQDRSSVHSWTKAELMQPTGQEEDLHRSTSEMCEFMNTLRTPSHLHASASTSSLPQFNQQHPHSHFDRQQSWPAYPVSDTVAPDITPGRLLAPSKSGSLQDAGTRKYVSLG